MRLQILSEPPGAGLQSEEEIATIAKEARIPVMTNQADDIDDLAGTRLSSCLLHLIQASTMLCWGLYLVTFSGHAATDFCPLS